MTPRRTARGFTPSQQPRYRELVARAWLAHSEREGIAFDADALYEDWYRANLMECIGVPSTVRANRVEDYDRACLHFAEIAGDENAMAYFSVAVERRVDYWIARRMKDLALLERRPVNWAYVRSIYAHMNLPLTIDDAPAEMRRKVLQALDTHVRRLRRRRVGEYRDAA